MRRSHASKHSAMHELRRARRDESRRRADQGYVSSGSISHRGGRRQKGTYKANALNLAEGAQRLPKRFGAAMLATVMDAPPTHRSRFSERTVEAAAGRRRRDLRSCRCFLRVDADVVVAGTVERSEDSKIGTVQNPDLPAAAHVEEPLLGNHEDSRVTIHDS